MARVAVMQSLRIGVDDSVNQGQKEFPSEVAVQAQIGVAQHSGNAAAASAPAVERSPFGRTPDWLTRLIGVAPVAHVRQG